MTDFLPAPEVGNPALRTAVPTERMETATVWLPPRQGERQPVDDHGEVPMCPDGARIMSEGDLRAPSLLPEWTRAHVLAHLARGADAMRNLPRLEEPG